jgi:hypothetical protein
MNQFSKCLKEKLARGRLANGTAAPGAPVPVEPSPSIVPATASAPVPAAEPISAFALLAKVMFNAIAGLLRRRKT